MHEMRNILFATDFSPSAEHALRYAVALAKRQGGNLHFVHVLDAPRGAGPGAEAAAPADGAVEAAEERLASLCAAAAERGIEAKMTLLRGKAWEEIVGFAEQEQVDLVLLATHGHSGFEHLVFGGTCEKVVRMSLAPVLAIKHPEHEFVKEDGTEIHLKRILCPYDFSGFSRQALPAAAALCRSFGATLVLAHVLYPYFEFPGLSADAAVASPPLPQHPAQEALAQVASELEGVQTEIQVLQGVPHRELKAFMEKTEVDLVVMATHGHTGIVHLLLGSVAEKILRTAPCPVLTIRPAAAE